MSNKDCTRCHNPIPDRPGEGWVKKVLLRKQTTRYGLRLDRWRVRWWPENPADRVQLTYSELDLCSPCSVAVWMYAQGKEAQR